MGISYYNERGEITGQLSGDAIVIELTKEMTTDAWVDGEWYGKPVYVLAGEVLDRPACPAIYEAGALINLPVPCTIDINGTRYECADDSAELDLAAGAHTITIIAWPYLDGVFNVEN